MFQSSRDGNNEIYVMNPDGSGQTRLTSNTFSDTLPSFSPDGSKIIFVSNRDGNNEIYVMNADGSAQTRLTNNAADDTAPAWVFPVPANPPSVSISDATVTEGTGGTTNLDFTVSLSAASTGSIAVFYKTADISAVAPTDYTSNSPSVTFLPGQTSQTISIAVQGDASDEDDETLQVSLSHPIGAILGDSLGIGTIIDDDGPPTLSIADAAQNEGDSNLTNYTLTVNVSVASSRQITVQYATGDGTATQPQDYTSTVGTLTIPAGSASQTFTIPVVGDTTRESDETFQVTLSNPVNATLDDSQATATLVNDDFPFISVSDATITEGDSGSVNAVFTVTLAETSSDTVAFDYSTASGSASAGADYTTTNGSHTFLPGDTTTTISVPVLGDVLDEVDEIFTLKLTNLVKADLGDDSGIGTIVDDDAPPTLSIADVNQAEGDSGATNVSVTVTLSSISSLPVTVNYATSDGTALQPGDYTTKTGAVTIPAGSTTTSLTVSVIGDTVKEVDETFLVTLSSPTNATLADAQATVTIANNDPISLSIEGSSITEGDSGQANVTFTVTLSDPLANPVTFDFATSNNSAVSGSDYISTSGSRTLQSGQTSLLIQVPVLGDTLDENDETFKVTLSNPVNANLGISSALSTIQDNDAPAVVSISDVSRLEGNSGTTSFSFVVSLSTPSSKVVSVSYATADNTAIQPGDYTARTGTVYIFPGSLNTTAVVTVNADTVKELHESFNVVLSSPSNATLGDDTGIGTILNDDFPVISISGSTVTESNTSGQVASFTLTLSDSYFEDVSVDFATTPGTATAGADYTTTSGSRTFVPGQTTKTITVPIIGDTIDENDETFSVSLSNPINCVLAATLPQDPATNHAYEFITSSLNWDAARNAAASRTYMGATGHLATITSASEQSFIAALVSGTDTWIGALQPAGSVEPGGGFTWITGETVVYTNWRAGEPNNVAPVGIEDTILFTSNGTWNDISTQAITQHYLVEYDLNAPTSGPASAGATILDNDAAPQISINDVTVTEGTSTTQAVFTISVTGNTEKSISVDVITVDGTAVASADYTSVNTTVSIPAGQSSATLSVPVLSDNLNEGAETFLVNLSAPFNATVADGQGVGTITSLPNITINDLTLPEGNIGTTNATFTVKLSAPSTQNVSVAFATANTSATQPSDYTSTSGTLTFAAGETAKTITVPIVGDSADEPTETFKVNLANATNATIADNLGVGIITDDDALPTLSIADATPVIEDGVGARNSLYVVTLSGATNRTVKVNYATGTSIAVGSATSDVDFTAVSGTMTFTPGQTTKTIVVPVLPDNLDEKDEVIRVNLSSASLASITKGQGQGSITDNDATPTLSINDVMQAEGNSGTTNFVFTVSLSAASGQTVTTSYQADNGTAIKPGDYTGTGSTLTFASGETIKMITVVVKGETINEADETFMVNLSNAVNASFAKNQGTGTILNDDASG